MRKLNTRKFAGLPADGAKLPVKAAITFALALVVCSQGAAAVECREVSKLSLGFQLVGFRQALEWTQESLELSGYEYGDQDLAFIRGLGWVDLIEQLPAWTTAVCAGDPKTAGEDLVRAALLENFDTIVKLGETK